MLEKKDNAQIVYEAFINDPHLHEWAKLISDIDLKRPRRVVLMGTTFKIEIIPSRFDSVLKKSEERRDAYIAKLYKPLFEKYNIQMSYEIPKKTN